MKFYADSSIYHCELHQSKKNLPWLFMLHGFMGSGRVFEHLLDGLTPFCNPVTLDLAGHGKTESPDDPFFYTTERQVCQLTSIIRRLQFDDLRLYGYSMGGRLAFQMLASFPELFSGAVIESSHCGITSEKERIDRIKIDEKRAQQIEKDFDGFIAEWIRFPLFKHTPPSSRAVYKKIISQQKPENMSASLRGFGAGEMPPVCDQLHKISTPLALITGEHDHKYMNRMRDISNRCDSAQFHIINNAGHRVHTDQPEELIECVKKNMSEF